MQIGVHRQLFHLFGRYIGPVGDGVVIEHTRQACSADHRREVRLRLAPIAAIDVRRQYHQTAATGLFRGAGKSHTLGGAQPCDPRDQRYAPIQRGDACPQDLQLFLVHESSRLAERSQGNQAGTAGVDHPGGVICEKRVIHRQIFSEGSGNRGKHPRPVTLLHAVRLRDAGTMK